MMALEDNIDKTSLPLIIWHAALCRYFMINKYNVLTYESSVYRIAMSVSLFVLSF